MKIKSLIVGMFLASVSVSAFSQKEDCATTDKLTTTTLRGKYSFVDCFYEDRAVVADNINSRNTKFGFIDTTGKLIIPIQFSNATNFEQGRSLVKQNDKQFFIDKSGKKILSLDDYLLTFPFSENLAMVIKSIDNQQKFGFINSTGKVAIPPKFDVAHEFSDGLALVKQDKQQFFIDKTGKKVIDLSPYPQVQSFSNGLAKVGTSWDCDNKYGFIDTTGKLVIPTQFTSAEDFSDGLALVEKDEKQFFIDTTGKQAIDLSQYYLAEPFKNGMAKVAKKEENQPPEYGFIDTTGKIVIPIEYAEISDFINNTAFASTRDSYGNRRAGMINRQNQVILPFDYSSIIAFASNYGLILAIKGCDNYETTSFNDEDSKKCRYGVVNEQNNVIIPFEYQQINPFKDGVAIAKKNDLFGKIDKQGKVIVPFTQANQAILLEELMSE